MMSLVFFINIILNRDSVSTTVEYIPFTKYVKYIKPALYSGFRIDLPGQGWRKSSSKVFRFELCSFG